MPTTLIDIKWPDEVAEIVKSDGFYADAQKKDLHQFWGFTHRVNPKKRVTLVHLLRNKNQLEKIAGAVYLINFIDAVPLSVNPNLYTGIF